MAVQEYMRTFYYCLLSVPYCLVLESIILTEIDSAILTALANQRFISSLVNTLPKLGRINPGSH